MSTAETIEQIAVRVRPDYMRGHRQFAKSGGLKETERPGASLLSVRVPSGADEKAFRGGYLDAWSQARHPNHFDLADDFARHCRKIYEANEKLAKDIEP